MSRRANAAKLGSSAPRNPTIKLCLLVFVIALLARGAFGTVRLIRSGDLAQLEFPDEEQYWMIATSLAEGDGMRDELGFRAGRMPLYPGLLAPFTQIPRGVVFAKILQWIIGAAAASLCCALGTRLFSRPTGLIAGLLVALDPFLIFFSSLLLTETIFIAALLLCWLAVAPLLSEAAAPGDRASDERPAHHPLRAWFVLGCAGAVAVHARESTILLIPAVIAVVLWHRRSGISDSRFRSRRFSRELLGAVVAVVCVFASLIPWSMRNEAVLGEYVWLTTRGGISLYDGLQQGTTGASDLGDVKDAPAVQHLGELERDAHFRHIAIEEMRRDPARVLRLAGAKIVRMWSPFPNVDTYQSPLVRLVSAAWTVPTLALAALGAALLVRRKGRRGALLVMLLLLPAIYLTAVHSVFVGSVRYRLGAIPMLHLLAAFALTTMFPVASEESATNEGQRAS